MREEKPEEAIIIDTEHQKLHKKKIYFPSENTAVKIGYDHEVGVWYVEIEDVTL